MKKPYKKPALVMAALVSLVATPALHAQEDQVTNTQSNWAATRAKLDSAFSRVSDNIALTAAAISNSFSLETSESSDVVTFQETWASTRADLSLSSNDTIGLSRITAASLANSANVNIDASIEEGLQPSFFQSTQVTQQGSVSSNLNIEGSNVDAPTADELASVISGVAIGNSLTAASTGNFTGLNDQYFGSTAISTLQASLDNVRGDLQSTSAAIGNSARFDAADTTMTYVNSKQVGKGDARADSSLTFQTIEGSVTSTTAAISNSLSVTTLPAAANVEIQNTQVSEAQAEALVAISLGAIIGSADVTAAAIGNSATIDTLGVGQ